MDKEENKRNNPLLDLPLRRNPPARAKPLTLAEFSAAIAPCITLYDIPDTLQGKALETATRQLKDDLALQMFEGFPPSLRVFLYLHAKSNHLVLKATTETDMFSSPTLMTPEEKEAARKDARKRNARKGEPGVDDLIFRGGDCLSYGNHCTIRVATGACFHKDGRLKTAPEIHMLSPAAEPHPGFLLLHETLHHLDNTIHLTERSGNIRAARMMDRFHLSVLNLFASEFVLGVGVTCSAKNAENLEREYQAVRTQFLEANKTMDGAKWPPTTLREYLLRWMEPVAGKDAVAPLQSESLSAVVDYALLRVMGPNLGATRPTLQKVGARLLLVTSHCLSGVVDVAGNYTGAEDEERAAVLNLAERIIYVRALISGEAVDQHVMDQEAFPRTGELLFDSLHPKPRIITSDQDSRNNRLGYVLIPFLTSQFNRTMDHLPEINQMLAAGFGLPCPGSTTAVGDLPIRESTRLPKLKVRDSAKPSGSFKAAITGVTPREVPEDMTAGERVLKGREKTEEEIPGRT